MDEHSTAAAPGHSADGTAVKDLPEFTVRPGVNFPDWTLVRSPEARTALLAMLGPGNLLSRWGGCDPTADRVRVALLELYAQDGQAPTTAAIARCTGMSEAVVKALLADLRRHDLVVLDGERITGAYPFTDRETGHRVTLAGSAVNAMCAVDALGIGGMMGQDTAIASHCRHCGTPVRITTRERGRALEEVQPPAAVMWQSTRYESACAASSLCTATAFFCSDEHLAAWRAGQGTGETGYRLSLDEGLEAGRAIFEPSLAGRRAATS